jgi:predicted nucleic acid-binding protein
VVLVDSSVWVLLPEVADISALVNEDEIVTCGPVIEEVLRGARSERDYRNRTMTFSNMTVIQLPMGRDLFEEAAVLFRTARRAGFTIRSPYDCLIASCAIRSGVPVVHFDRDFTHLARVSPLLQRNLAH